MLNYILIAHLLGATIWEFPKNCVTAYNPLTGE